MRQIYAWAGLKVIDFKYFSHYFIVIHVQFSEVGKRMKSEPAIFLIKKYFMFIYSLSGFIFLSN